MVLRITQRKRWGVFSRYGFLSESTWPDRVLREFWPDGTPYDPAQPEVPGHLITYDEVGKYPSDRRQGDVFVVVARKGNSWKILTVLT